MKIITKLSPKRLFRCKKDRSTVSRSDPSSFSSGTTSSTSSDSSDNIRKSVSGGGVADIGTPTSVLPEISGEWSDNNNFEGNNNSEIISKSQLEALFARLGAEPPSEEEINMMISEIDHDGDGCINVDDLLNRFVGSVSCDSGFDSELRETFDFFDTDHDGKITAEELLGVFTSIGEQCTLEDCRRMISGVDKSGDGFVCFEDFTRMMELQR